MAFSLRRLAVSTTAAASWKILAANELPGSLFDIKRAFAQGAAGREISENSDAALALKDFSSISRRDAL